MLWKLSDASLIGDDGSELDADDLLCIFHCNQAKAKVLILPSFPLLQQDCSRAIGREVQYAFDSHFAI